MYQAAAALKTFFSGFGLPAYTADSVPEDAELPYITYSASQPEWDQKASLYAQVWERTQSNAGILRMADRITAAIGEGKRIPLEDGYLVIWPETPLIQIMVDGDHRSAYINLSVNVYQKAGA
jgi:hypothetical protein